MRTFDDLQKTLAQIDGRGYQAYKDLAHAFVHPSFTLLIDHVQGDPFSTPSRIRVRVPSMIARMPPALCSNAIRRIALQDILIRVVDESRQMICQGNRGIGHSGLVSIDVGGQEVLERTAMVVTESWIEARMQVGLPARGRTILGRQAEAMLCQELPRLVLNSLRWDVLDQKRIHTFVDCVDNQEAIRTQLDTLGLLVFIADGSMLARISGEADHPLTRVRAHAFQSPPSLQVTIPVPHMVNQQGHMTKILTGLGIPKGINLIVGGGYHGTSTLLRAIERGVYAHIPGDGREYVVTVDHAVKTRAEDGRRIEHVDISGFMTNLPSGQETTQFSTDHASGSTSQMATMLEAIEINTKVLLIDEDTSATNFLVRDARMQALVHSDHEPITPFLDRIRELYDVHGVSTILVMGGCGDYFDVANTVIMMRAFQPVVVTAEAHQIAHEQQTQRRIEAALPLTLARSRMIYLKSLDVSSGKREAKIDAKSVNVLAFGQDLIDLSGVAQLVDVSQTRAVGYAIHMLRQRMNGTHIRLADAVSMIETLFA